MRSAKAGRIVHALLLSGPIGTGKRAFAEKLAQAALCTGDGAPCGTCAECRRVATGNHPDVHVLRLQKSKTIGVEEARGLIGALSMKAFENGKRVAIIEQADKLTVSAQNALLKTLESPPGDALMMLLTDSPGALLKTIASRCLTVRFSPLPVADCARALAESGMPESRARLLAGLSQGCYGRALTMDADEGYLALYERVLESLRVLKKTGDAIAAVNPIANDRDRADDVLEMLEMLGRDRMAETLGAPPFSEASDANIIDGQALLTGALELRRRVAGNVSWQSALEILYFGLAARTNGRKNTLWRP